MPRGDPTEVVRIPRSLLSRIDSLAIDGESRAATIARLLGNKPAPIVRSDAVEHRHKAKRVTPAGVAICECGKFRAVDGSWR